MKRYAVIASVLGATLLAAAEGQTILYVDAHAAVAPHDGSSWCQAHLELHEALAQAGPDTIIRVAGGVYRPDPSGLAIPRDATFQLISGVTIEGGYAGCGDGGDLRHMDRHETVLSGDLGTIGSRADNTYHVVTGSGTDATAVLDGVTITGGHADGSDPRDRGAGLYNDTGGPTIRRCTFVDNTATFGGGMFNDNANPLVIKCTFDANAAAGAFFGLGGGMCNLQSHPTVADCTFTGNQASGYVGYGGAMANTQSNPLLQNGLFVGNSASFGGGLHNTDQSSPTLVNCTFHGNLAAEGGAVYVQDTGVNLANCILWGDEPDEIYSVEQAGEVTFSCIQDDEPGDGVIYPGTGNRDEDPDFASGGDLRLAALSPCIDTGSNEVAELPEADLDGHARVLCGTTDMGAYETGIGDDECDRDVDLHDFAVWAACVTGPHTVPMGPYSDGCESFDFEFDGDVDLRDLAGFFSEFTGVP